MKLKKIAPSNTAVVRSTTSFISINMRGIICFNKTAFEALGLQDGCACIFHQDEDEPSDWYVEFVEEDGYILRDLGKASKGLAFNSKASADLIAQSLCDMKGVDIDNVRSLSIRIATEPTKHEGKELYALLAGSVIFRENKS